MNQLILFNVGQLLTLQGPQGPRRGRELAELGIIENAAVLCAGGKVVAAGREREILNHPWTKKNKKKLRELDCAGGVVLPGFVDSHTHLVFAGPRLMDFEKRIAGWGYEEIAKAGGGIRSSVEALRKASRAELAANALAALHQMSAHGTTTVEAKSGYGLSQDAELKTLEATADAAKSWPGTVVATLLAAHVVPKEFEGKADAYVRLICQKVIPAAARRKLAKFVDVFIERSAFTLEQAEQIFEAAREHGLGVRAHACQLSQAELWPLLRFHPASFDHLDHISEEDLPQMARRNTLATLLPTSNYFLGLHDYPPARRMIEAGVAVALATDFNPGTSPTFSMQAALSAACTQMRMSPAEAVSAATINGAHALGLAAQKGSIEPGKDADLALFDARDYREIAYWFGSNRCAAAMIGGELFASA